jgi:hypothetical protein
VMLERVEEVEVGERSRSAMAARKKGCSTRRGRGLEGRGTDARRRPTVWAGQRRSRSNTAKVYAQ